MQGRGRGTADLEGRARGAAHEKHVEHVRDARGVPAQWLVEGQRVLPRVASRAHGAGRAAGREAGGGKRARLAPSGQGGGLRLQIEGHGARGAAHGKRRVHVLDAGGVPPQGLVEDVRLLPRVASRAHGTGAGCGPGEAAGAASEHGVHTQRAGERVATADIGGKGRGAAHGKHVAHVRDARGVPAQGLVEGRRALPRVASRAHARCGAGRKAGGGG